MKIAYIGGGSILWCLYIVQQLIDSEFLAGTCITLMDIDPVSLEFNKKACSLYNSEKGLPVDIITTTSLDTALKGADFVIISITTGGLEAMRHDIDIPERYGIFHTVGDTVGPAGWARAWRNIPVFYDFGRKMKALCPDAWLLNLSNPLSVLTRVPQKCFGIKSVGLCHSVDNMAVEFSKLAGETENLNPDYIAAGIDHSSFFLKLFVNGRDVLATLKQKGYCCSDGRLPGSAEAGDSHAEASNLKVAFSLWRELGYLPAISDRHLVENYPWFINSSNPTLSFNTKRTSIDERYKWKNRRKTQIENYIRFNDKDVFREFSGSHDPISKIIESLCGFRYCISTANYMNIGQIPDVPQGAVVETRCCFDQAGVHPLCSPLPDILKTIIVPTIYRQESIIDIALSGTFDEIAALVLTDPLCARISPADCRKMMRELLEANTQDLCDEQLPKYQCSTSLRQTKPLSRVITHVTK